MSIFGTPFFVCTSSTGLMMSMMSTIKGLLPAAAAVGRQIATAAGAAAAEAAHVGPQASPALSRPLAQKRNRLAGCRFDHRGRPRRRR
ncbi:MAG: hypothetical protein K2X97_00920 [Mycobacteriaceae bacterium]|nr:hypothetical protein [Mycobacteriaceae bacterium]